MDLKWLAGARSGKYQIKFPLGRDYERAANKVRQTSSVRPIITQHVLSDHQFRSILRQTLYTRSRGYGRMQPFQDHPNIRHHEKAEPPIFDMETAGGRTPNRALEEKVKRGQTR